MIPKLRKKFVSITAAALFSIILVVMIAINGIFIYQSNRSLDTRVDMIINEHDREGKKPTPENPPLNSFFKESSPDTFFDFRKSDYFENVFHGFTDNLHIRADGCIIILNSDNTIKEVRQDAAENYTPENLASIVSQIMQSGKEKGWQEYFKYRLTTRTDSEGTAETVIVLLNASSDIYSIRAMLLISTGIGLLSLLIILVIIIFASGKAVKPFAEIYAKQRQFVTDAGHELKTPLTVISANNELARMIYGDSEWFDGIDNQVSKMNTLVRNLITLAKMDEEQKPVFSSFNLSDAVYDTAKSFENLIHAGGRVITLDIAEDILFTGDEAGLRQVVSILIDNAIKYCDEKGKIAIKMNNDKNIRLQVINDYSSADNCDFTKVFERFYRADPARTSDGSYGLGLSIAKSIVELHRGNISAKPMGHDRIMFEVILNESFEKSSLSRSRKKNP